jgi:hypothetical protein
MLMCSNSTTSLNLWLVCSKFWAQLRLVDNMEKAAFEQLMAACMLEYGGFLVIVSHLMTPHNLGSEAKALMFISHPERLSSRLGVEDSWAILCPDSNEIVNHLYKHIATLYTKPSASFGDECTELDEALVQAVLDAAMSRYGLGEIATWPALCAPVTGGSTTGIDTLPYTLSRAIASSTDTIALPQHVISHFQDCLQCHVVGGKLQTLTTERAKTVRVIAEYLGCIVFSHRPPSPSVYTIHADSAGFYMLWYPKSSWDGCKSLTAEDRILIPSSVSTIQCYNVLKAWSCAADTSIAPLEVIVARYRCFDKIIEAAIQSASTT